MNMNYRLSQVGQTTSPYQWEAYVVADTLRFDTNTLPFPPPSAERVPVSAVSVNEYGDPNYTGLKRELASYERVSQSMITVTDSGDEAIDILSKTFLDPGDRFVITPPTYEMFDIQCRINRGIPIEIPLVGKTFAVNAADIIKASRQPRTQLIFLVNPNNPTGSVIPQSTLRRIVSAASCAVVVDEAYGEFYGKTAVQLTKQYDNLIVLKTFSKFAGLAGARVGYLIANRNLSRVFNTVRFPMGVSSLSSRLAETVLKNDRRWIRKQISMIRAERRRLAGSLTALGFVVYPSEANFLLVNMGNRARSIASRLTSCGIIIRDRSAKPYLSGCVRITVRSERENNKLINALKEIV